MNAAPSLPSLSEAGGEPPDLEDKDIVVADSLALLRDILWGLRLKICQGFDQYANVRPTRILPGIDAPLKRCTAKDLDWVIVRENSEGEYSGVGGRAHQGHPIEVATDVSMMTRAGVERIMRYAFKLAQSRPRKLLTVVTKSNAQRHAMVMWDEIALQISKEFPDVSCDKELVDACTARMVNRPASLDTIVATNLHADILSDLAAALAGSLGIAPTGNIDPERRYPSMFEPIHGSAFDIMGKGLANPVGTFWSCVMLLEHLVVPAEEGGFLFHPVLDGLAQLLQKPCQNAVVAGICDGGMKDEVGLNGLSFRHLRGFQQFMTVFDFFDIRFRRTFSRHTDQGFLDGDPRFNEFMQLFTPPHEHSPAKGFGSRFSQGGAHVCAVSGSNGQHADQRQGADGLPQ